MSRKSMLRRVLFIMDPLSKLDPVWDNSLALIRELLRRGTQCQMTDTGGIWLKNTCVMGETRPLNLSKEQIRAGACRTSALDGFDVVLVRKEPPFDNAYYTLTLLLEHCRSPVVNSPASLRSANEKIWPLRFANLMPETLVSSDAGILRAFGRRFPRGCVIKPLDEKGGRGVFKVTRSSSLSLKKIRQATQNGRKAVIAQRFLHEARGIDKRIVLLNGRLLCAFEKHPAGNDFRANLGLGASAHKTQLNAREKAIVGRLAPVLKKEGIFLAGLDVMAGKLIEMNITSPAGMTDAQALYPEKNFIGVWADWLESFVKRKNR